MNKLFKKIDRIRGSGTAMLDLRPNSPYFHLDGQVFAVHSIGTPGLKCPVVLIIEGEQVEFSIDDIH
ncbi:hypothetical protein CA265_20800 [Sphingobacteriaceae bacterium GW460-11-11-14-LB5]|nr:hypothetical protein CA265_20800 [Sphingobacteriaceae bacterium GW460-11-11-14-LB5]